MFQIAKDHTQNWKGHGNYLAPSFVSFNCVNLSCCKPFDNQVIKQWNSTPSFAWTTMACPWCGTRATLFLVDPRREEEGEDNSRLYIYPPPPREAISQEISDLSPRFGTIITQARIAEAQDLTELAGMGYRKALEILTKDYLIAQHPHKKDEIEKEWLSKSIERIDDMDLQELARRAVWLGNDETHYTRRWKNKDLNDLKFLVEHTVGVIANRLKARRHIDEMKP